ncbi:MAG TPA: sigma-70 family RNA polymerase sigma factor [Acidimicrobiales bacterium]|nr:sigma-70 family RNA polymerase sigma factor [Acidimicrobiales bacterium]
MSSRVEIEDLLRQLAPQVLGSLLRRHGGLDACEDAVQEALAAAAMDWPARGLPDNPRAWLVTVANRRLVDLVRSDAARRRREERMLVDSPPAESLQPLEERLADRDDTLLLLLLCCHPALTPSSQVALTLRAVGGLTTAQIAAAFFVPEATMAQRISRAKARIQDAGASFVMPPPDELDTRLQAVMHVLYLIFNEGYTTSSGPEIHRPDLTREAVRLTRELARLRPDDAEVAGLLALMLLTEARRPARTTPGGDLIPLAQQDRTLWDQEAIGEGVELVTSALRRGPIGAYQLQAAIAAVHDEAARAEDTDWVEVLALYETLDRVSPNPMATINRAVAAGMVHGPQAGLALLATADNDERVSAHHLLFAVRGHLLEMAGDLVSAAEAFSEAARRTNSVPEKRHLARRAADLRVTGSCGSAATRPTKRIVGPV